MLLAENCAELQKFKVKSRSQICFIFNETSNPNRHRVHERRVLRRQGREGKCRGWLQQYRRRGVRFRSTLVDGARRAPEARPAAVHVPGRLPYLLGGHHSF